MPVPEPTVLYKLKPADSWKCFKAVQLELVCKSLKLPRSAAVDGQEKWRIPLKAWDLKIYRYLTL